MRFKNYRIAWIRWPERTVLCKGMSTWRWRQQCSLKIIVWSEIPFKGTFQFNKEKDIVIRVFQNILKHHWLQLITDRAKRLIDGNCSALSLYDFRFRHSCNEKKSWQMTSTWNFISTRTVHISNKVFKTKLESSTLRTVVVKRLYSPTRLI